MHSWRASAEFRGMRRTAVPGKIGWRSAGEDPGLQEPAGDESRRFRLAKTHGGVEPVGHEVAGDGRAPGSPPTGPDKPSGICA